MPCFGICYAVVWYALCRTGMYYAVVFGMGYAVVLRITHIVLWIVTQFARGTELIYPPFSWQW
jgi:hypothetical protein